MLDPMCMQVYEETAGLCVGDVVKRTKKVCDATCITVNDE
jgi:vacuolar-type H+-ATPase catalytic subunit A/Vma1